MQEANKSNYFVDGFMLKYFDVWPIGVDKNNLFEEQKIFLVYLFGVIPSLEDWNVQVDYKIKKEEIKNIKTIKLTKTDIDLALMQGKNIKELKKERTIQEKEKAVHELNEKFGIKNEPKKIEIERLPDVKKVDGKDRQEKLWDLLQGKNQNNGKE